MTRALPEGRPQSTPRPGQEEKTAYYIWDTIVYPVGTLMGEKQLFNSDSVPVQYRNIVGNVALEETMRIVEVQVTYEVAFTSVGGTAVAAGLIRQFQKYFEQFSTLRIERTNKKQPPIPLTMFQGHNVLPDGTTPVIGTRAVSRYKLLDPVVWDGGQNVKFFFTPANECVTGPYAAASTPILPGLGLTNNAGFYIRFLFIADNWRPTT